MQFQQLATCPTGDKQNPGIYQLAWVPTPDFDKSRLGAPSGHASEGASAASPGKSGNCPNYQESWFRPVFYSSGRAREQRSTPPTSQRGAVIGRPHGCTTPPPRSVLPTDVPGVHRWPLFGCSPYKAKQRQATTMMSCAY